MRFSSKYIALYLAVAVVPLYMVWEYLSASKIDFNTEVKPILNKHCIKCHGGVKQAGGFSVLFREEAMAKTKSGKPAIIPYHPEQSEFIKRLTVTDLDERMPYKEEQLSKTDIETLTQWIKEGAKFDTHWAYVAPKFETSSTFFASFFDFGTGKHSKIDDLINEKIEAEGLTANSEADKAILLRRLSLDITGLPPSESLKKAFLQEESITYENLVDSLLASPAYGEKWASMWLDLARYSDSRGYQKDNARNIWKYRDWVIEALNKDMPFDQFTIEQLAGDLLPNATDSQLIATAFHRNTMNNDETGTVDEEFRVAAVMDRVSTTYEVWQSTTMACVQCHTHPYDPFKHEDYYHSLAFFNNTRDEDTSDEAAFLREFKTEDNIKLQAVKNYINQTLGQKKANEYLHFFKTLEPRYHAHHADNYVKGALLGDRQIGLFHNGSCRLPSINLNGKSQLLINYANAMLAGRLQIRLGSPTGKIIAQMACDTTLKGKYELKIIPISPTAGTHDLYITAQNPKISAEKEVFRISWFKFLEEFPNITNANGKPFTDIYKELIIADTDETPIMQENPADMRRKNQVFERGNWLVKGKEVAPKTPMYMPKFDFAANRLGLAQWLIAPQNPLTARVMANRLWEQIFGVGMVETLEDFGTQGAKPSHPELLDYLAVKLQKDYKWSWKKLIKEIVLSETYKRSSEATADQLAKDPYNKYLARAPRLRLTAEQIRDQALAVSGLLNSKMYGPPVLPYQPDGIWNAVNSSLKYKQSEGADNYRRAIYTFQRRTSPYPSFASFDAGSREFCLSRRIRTNTPLQSLVLLNDPVYQEMSQAMALKYLKANNNDITHTISACYTAMFFREIKKEKLNKLVELYQYTQKKMETKDPVGAMTVVCNAMLSLDEWLVK